MGKTSALKKAAPVFVFLAGCLWGMIGLFVRRLSQYGFDSMEITALRSIAALFLMTVGLLLYKRNLFVVHWKDLWCFIGTGLFSLTFFNLCYFKTISMTSLSIAAILLYTAPSIVMLLSAILFREKIDIKKIVSLFLAFSGCVLVTGILGENQTIRILGILTGLGSGFGYALYSIFGRYALERNYHTLTITFYTFLFSAIGMLPFLSLHHVGEILTVNPSCIFLILLLGFFCTVCPYILYTVGLSGLEAGKASVIASVEPVMATIVGMIAFGEKMSLTGCAGIVLVLLSILIINRKSTS